MAERELFDLNNMEKSKKKVKKGVPNGQKKSVLQLFSFKQIILKFKYTHFGTYIKNVYKERFFGLVIFFLKIQGTGLVFFETLKNTNKNVKERKTSQNNPNHKEQVDENSKRFSQTIIFISMGQVDKTGFYYPNSVK